MQQIRLEGTYTENTRPRKYCNHKTIELPLFPPGADQAEVF